MSARTPPQKENFDLSYDYAEDLREVAQNPSDMALYVEALVQFVDDHLEQPKVHWDLELIASYLGEIGSYFKILRHLEEALDYLGASLSLIEENDLGVKPFVIHSLRYGDVLRFQNQYSEAKEIFEVTLNLCRQIPDVQVYLDLSLQHLGHLHYDLREHSEALRCFEEALQIRQVQKNSDLIAMTQKAIALTERRMTQN